MTFTYLDLIAKTNTVEGVGFLKEFLPSTYWTKGAKYITKAYEPLMEGSPSSITYAALDLLSLLISKYALPFNIGWNGESGNLKLTKY